jgi:hypothetical protein
MSSDILNLDYNELKSILKNKDGGYILRSIYYATVDKLAEISKQYSSSSTSGQKEDRLVNNIERLFNDHNLQLNVGKLGNDQSIVATQYFDGIARDSTAPNTEANLVKEWWIPLDKLQEEFMQNWASGLKMWKNSLNNDGSLKTGVFSIPFEKSKYHKWENSGTFKWRPFCYICGFSLFLELKKKNETGHWISYSVKTLDDAAKEIRNGAKLSLEVEHVFPIKEQGGILLGQPNVKKWANITEDLNANNKKHKKYAKSIFNIYNRVYLWSHTTCNQIKSCAGMTVPKKSIFVDGKKQKIKNKSARLFNKLQMAIPSYEIILNTIVNGKTDRDFKGNPKCASDTGTWTYNDNNVSNLDLDNLKLEYKPNSYLENNPGIKRNISFRNNIIAPHLEKLLKQRIIKLKKTVINENDIKLKIIELTEIKSKSKTKQRSKKITKLSNEIEDLTKLRDHQILRKKMEEDFEKDPESSPEEIYDGISSDFYNANMEYRTNQARKIGNRIENVIDEYNKKKTKDAIQHYENKKEFRKVLKKVKKNQTYQPHNLSQTIRDENITHAYTGDVEQGKFKNLFENLSDEPTSDSDSITSADSVEEVRMRKDSLMEISPQSLMNTRLETKVFNIKNTIQNKKKLKKKLGRRQIIYKTLNKEIGELNDELKIAKKELTSFNKKKSSKKSTTKKRKTPSKTKNKTKKQKSKKKTKQITLPFEPELSFSNNKSKKSKKDITGGRKRRRRKTKRKTK